MMQLKRFAAPQRYLAPLPLALLMGLLSSCALLPPPVPQPTAPAAQAVPRGDHAALAAQYESSAAGARAASEQAELKLSATREWLAAGRAVDAARVLASLRAAALTSAQSEERLLLDAETSLVAQRAQEAWAKIAALPEPTATNAAARYYPLKMRIAMAAGRPVDAVRAEIAAERYAAGVTERAALRCLLYTSRCV